MHHGMRCQVESLVNTVMLSWNNRNLSTALSKVFERLKRVLCLIVEGNGKNDLVESKRGKKEPDRDIRTDEDLRLKLDEFFSNNNKTDKNNTTNNSLPCDYIYDSILEDEEDEDDCVM